MNGMVCIGLIGLCRVLYQAYHFHKHAGDTTHAMLASHADDLHYEVISEHFGTVASEWKGGDEDFHDSFDPEAGSLRPQLTIAPIFFSKLTRIL